MTQKEYLRNNYYEETPEWLLAINYDSEIPWDDFFHSRTVFYPGSGTDGHTVAVFGGGHSAHCFINADYGRRRSEIERELVEHPFKGYHQIYSQDVELLDLLRLFKDTENFVPEETESKRIEHIKWFQASICRPYVKFKVFKRNPEFNEEWGVDRFALLILGLDVFHAFNDIYGTPGINLFATLIEDYGFGMQYEKFGNHELLHRLALKTNTMPELILCAGRDIWEEYEEIEGVDYSRGGMHHFGRALYKRKPTQK